MKPVRTAAIFGIDGSGKSALAQLFIEKFSHDPEPKVRRVITCPRYHHTPGTSHRDLSELFDRMNRLGDEKRDPTWKALSVYLQLTLYGPVKRELDKSPTSLVVSERHPLIDSLVYGPFLSKSISGNFDQEKIETEYFPILEAFKSNATHLLLDWFSQERKRLNLGVDFFQMPLALKALYAQEPRKLMIDLAQHFSTEMPDLAIRIDIDVETSLKRIQSRGGKNELHENHDGLTQLKNGYERAFQWLHVNYPKIRIESVRAEDGKNLETMAAEVLRIIG